MVSDWSTLSPFDNAWLECQIANYTQCARTAYNEDGAKTVLQLAGMSDEEIENLYIVATMRNDADDVLSVIEAKQKIHQAQHEASCQCAVCIQGDRK